MSTKKQNVRGSAKTLALVLMVAVALCGASPVLAANLLTNGSFETPVMTTNSWYILQAADTNYLTGWTYSAPGDSYALHINGKGPTGAATVISPQNGVQCMELDFGTAAGNVYIEQTMTGLTVGTSYSVEGYYAWLHRAGSEHGHFKVSVSGIGDILPSTLVSNDTQWTLFSAPFTATATSQTLRISSLGLNGGQQTGLDNISVNPVPEPVLGGLALAGLLAVLGRGRRRVLPRK